MKEISSEVATLIRADVERRTRKEGAKGHADVVNVGDSVFLRKPPKLLTDRQEADARGQAQSSRLLPYADPRPYTIMKKVGNSQAILADATGNTNLPFSQPVHVSRLIPYDLERLEAPINEQEDLKIYLS